MMQFKNKKLKILYTLNKNKKNVQIEHKSRKKYTYIFNNNQVQLKKKI